MMTTLEQTKLGSALLVILCKVISIQNELLILPEKQSRQGDGTGFPSALRSEAAIRNALLDLAVYTKELAE